jgi:6-phosphogluconolactonase
MADLNWKKSLKTFDDRRKIIVPGDDITTVQFCIEQFLSLAKEAIDDHDYFAVALSGGSTPKAIFQGILESKNCSAVDWRRVLLFWGDERCVPQDHPDSNYRMAMEAAFSKLPIPPENIFPMPVEGDLKHDAKVYEELIQNKTSGIFDLVMLGMGEDGHTASLFPKTAALHEEKILVAENYIPGKNAWRMTLTCPCINVARNIIVYVLGANKAQMIKKVFLEPYQPDILPIQKIGTPSHPALWVMDSTAAELLT